MPSIEGKIIAVSSPKEFRIDKKPSNYSSNVSDYYHVIVKENGTGNEVTVYLSTNSMGILNPVKSVISFQKGNQWIKTVMVNPRRFVGSRVIVEGEMKDKNYMNRVTALKLLS